jgi:hypothetical protein
MMKTFTRFEWHLLNLKNYLERKLKVFYYLCGCNSVQTLISSFSISNSFKLWHHFFEYHVLRGIGWNKETLPNVLSSTLTPILGPDGDSYLQSPRLESITRYHLPSRLLALATCYMKKCQKMLDIKMWMFKVQ